MKVQTHAIRALDALGLPYRLVTQSHQTRHVVDTAAERGTPVERVAKTLLVRRPDGKHLIALVRGDQRLSLKKLARIAGVRVLEMAPLDDVPRVTGYQAGAVSPFGQRRSDLPFYVDQHILEEPVVGVSAGRHDAGIELAPADLVRGVKGQVADITE
ncbi:MAG TPA: YbaK/EbsC family protein [Anaerolineae bacterium]|nr:YbaK/EbsC family protein [Anaerolineae bacterium]